MFFVFSDLSQVNKLRLEEMKDEPLKFTLAAKTPGGDNLIIQAMTPEDKEKWVKEVKVLIAQQADMLRGKGLTLLASGKGLRCKVQVLALCVGYRGSEHHEIKKCFVCYLKTV